MEIEYIELVTSDYSIYRIDKKDLVECNYMICDDVIDASVTDNTCNNLEVPIIDNLLLIIDNYENIISYDEENFDIDNKDISQIAIYYNDDTSKMAYVNLTSEHNNDNQLNYLIGDRLYITIEENI